MVYSVSMYITDVLTKTKKVNTRTIANLTHCNPREVAAMRLALQHKGELTVLKSLEDVDLRQGMSVGAAWLLYQVAQQSGIEKALGKGARWEASVLNQRKVAKRWWPW